MASQGSALKTRLPCPIVPSYDVFFACTTSDLNNPHLHHRFRILYGLLGQHQIRIPKPGMGSQIRCRALVVIGWDNHVRSQVGDSRSTCEIGEWRMLSEPPSLLPAGKGWHADRLPGWLSSPSVLAFCVINWFIPSRLLLCSACVWADQGIRGNTFIEVMPQRPTVFRESV